MKKGAACFPATWSSIQVIWNSLCYTIVLLAWTGISSHFLLDIPNFMDAGMTLPYFLLLQCLRSSCWPTAYDPMSINFLEALHGAAPFQDSSLALANKTCSLLEWVHILQPSLLSLTLKSWSGKPLYVVSWTRMSVFFQKETLCTPTFLVKKCRRWDINIWL